MLGATKAVALAVAAGSVVTVAVVRGNATVEKQPGAQSVALAAGERATMPAPEPERAVASTAEAMRSTPAPVSPAPAAGAPAEGECPPEMVMKCEDEDAPAHEEPLVTVPTAGAPTMGSSKAKVTIVEFSDFQCKFCEKALSEVHALARMYPNDVRIVFKNFPIHKDSHLAAEAALAAGEQGKYWEMHDILLANQEQLDRPALESYAKQLGLDLGKFRRALDDHRFAAAIDDDFKDGTTAGVVGVPTFYINGRVIRGAHPLEDFKKVVDEELAK